MSVWIDRIKNHPVWETLKTLGTTLDIAAVEELTVDGVSGLERIKEVLAFTGKRLAATDPFMLSAKTLDLLTTNLNTVISELDEFVEDGDDDHITTANSTIDEVLIQVSNILTPIPTEDITVINDSISQYRNTLDKHLSEALGIQTELEQKILDNEKILAEHTQKLTDEQVRLVSVLTEYQTVFSSNQDARATEYSTAMSDFQTQFSASQIAIQEKVGTLITTTTEKLNQQQSRLTNQQDKAGKSYKEDLAKLRLEFEGGASVILDEINTHRKEVEDLVGIIGNLGVTSGYLNEANTARKTQYLWQGLTVLALGGLIGVAYLMAFPPEVHAMGKVAKDLADKAAIAGTTAGAKATVIAASTEFLFYQSMATRIFLSITFGVFAAYSATQAEKYMEMDRRNRKLALELAAVGPYIAPLPFEMQNKFRAELGEKSFGVLEPTRKGNKDPVTAIDVLKSKELEQVLAKVLDIFRREKKEHE